MRTEHSPARRWPDRLGGSRNGGRPAIPGRGGTRRGNGGGPARTAVETLESRLLLAVFTVTSTADSGEGSLRWAIDRSNYTDGYDTIAFNLPAGNRVIRTQTELPGFWDPATLDATTQPGYAGKPLVQLDGSAVPDFPNGSNPTGIKLFGNSTIKGLSITGFRGSCIDTLLRPDQNFTGNIIQRNWFGVDLNGGLAPNRAFGVGLWTGGNTIGGKSRADGNVISGSRDGQGIYNWGPNNGGNVIRNNLIGTDPTGTLDYGNFKNGVFIADAPNTIIQDNVISGNGDDGIFLNLENCRNTQIRGNIIGLDATGTRAIPNGLYGMEIQTADNIIGGPEVADRNIISANPQAGIVFWGGYANFNRVENNYIGTDITGTRAIGNGYQGIAFSGGNDNLIKGNVISGNGQEGIGVFPGWRETIVGNYIGAGADLRPLGNGSWGIVVINGSKDTTIGGSGRGAGNYIAYNGKAGVYAGEPRTVVVANTITNNKGDGVQIAGWYGHRVEANSIYANGGLGINIGWDSISYNDPGDGDDGPNAAQNYPVLSAASSDGASTRITGALDSLGGKAYTICFYASPAADPSGYGEGQTYLGQATAGAGGIDVTLPVGVPAGRVITATATDPDGNTSEFSPAIAVSGTGGNTGGGGGGTGGSGDTTAPQVIGAALDDQQRPNFIWVQFSENVAGSIDLADLSVTDKATGKLVNPRSVVWGRKNVARFWFKAVLPDGKYRVVLNGAGVADAAGNPLGANYAFDVFHLAGDANHDGSVDKTDRAILRANLGRTGARFSQGDFNYDGVVNKADADILARNWYKVL